METQVNDLLFKMWGELKSVATPIAIIAIVFLGIKLLLSSDAQTVKQTKTSIIVIVVALAIIYFAPTLVNLILSAVGGTQSTWG